MVEGWKLYCISCIFFKDIIVKMDSNDGINLKDVFFLVWYNDIYIFLYDNVYCGKYIFKINNLDIWVFDVGFWVVVGRSWNVLYFNWDYFVF